MESASEMLGTMMFSHFRYSHALRKISAAGMMTSARSSFRGEGNLALLDARGLHHRVETLQFGKRRVFGVLLAVACQLVQLVDVATRTDDPDVAVLLGISRRVLLEELFGFGSHLAAQHSQSTHVVGIAFGEHTVMDDTHLRGTTAHINVGKAALVGICFLYQVVVEELCLLLPFDDF